MPLNSMPFLVVNYGCEMMFVLHTRMQAQQLEPPKVRQIVCDILNGMFSNTFMDELFRPQEMYTHAALRKLFTTLCDSSIMRLNENSMSKLFNLMSMTVKFQLLGLHHPYEMLEYTVNHLEELKHISPPEVYANIDNVVQRVSSLCMALSVGELARVRQTMLNALVGRRVRVSTFVDMHVQFADGSFKLPPDGCLPALSNVHAPGSIHYHTATGTATPASFPHRDAMATYPPGLTAGQWGPRYFTAAAPRATRIGANLYRSSGHKDVLAAMTREMPSPSGATPNTTSAAPSAVEVSAYKNEVSHLSQLLGSTHQQSGKRESVRLRLFDGDDADDEYADSAPSAAASATSSRAAVATPPASVTTPQGSQTPLPSAHNSRTTPITPSTKEPTPVKVCKMDAAAVRQENHQLLGIINGLDNGKGSSTRGAKATAQSNGTASPTAQDAGLLDIMDEA